MAGRGRPRKPTQSLKLHGGYRSDRHGDRDQEPQLSGDPVPPFKLVGDANLLWESVVPRLVAAKIATEADSETLAMMCEWYRKFRKLQKALDKMAVTNKDHYKLMIQMQMASNCFDKLAARFGMTPADRSRVKTHEPAQQVSGLAASARSRGA